jgi:hypothetical protein
MPNDSELLNDTPGNGSSSDRLSAGWSMSLKNFRRMDALFTLCAIRWARLNTWAQFVDRGKIVVSSDVSSSICVTL